MQGAVHIGEEGPKELNPAPAVSQEKAMFGVIGLDEGSGETNL